MSRKHQIQSFFLRTIDNFLIRYPQSLRKSENDPTTPPIIAGNFEYNSTETLLPDSALKDDSNAYKFIH